MEYIKGEVKRHREMEVRKCGVENLDLEFPVIEATLKGSPTDHVFPMSPEDAKRLGVALINAAVEAERERTGHERDVKKFVEDSPPG